MLGFLALSARSISGLLHVNIPAVPGGDTHDYPFGAGDWLKKRHERQAKLRREQEDKNRAANNIRQQIEDALYPQEAEEQVTGENLEKIEEKEQITPVIARDLRAELELVENQLLALQAFQRQEEIAYRRAKDEEDMKVILRLLQ